jgi:hypothetical protein
MMGGVPTTSTADVLDAAVTRRYLKETVRVWLGLPAGAHEAVPALPDRLARRLLRLVEYERQERDRWGRWEYDLSERLEEGRPDTAELDQWLAARRAELESSTRLEPLWPHSKPFAVCLTHDVDLLSAKSTPRQIARYAWAGLEGDGRAVARYARPPVRVARSLRAGVALAPSAAETLERSVAIVQDRGANATYLFTLPGASRFDCVYAPSDLCRFRGARRRIADVMCTLADEGLDVGLHGSYNAGVRPGLLASERAQLEAATGVQVTTTRQHLLHWEVRATPRLQEEAGLRVDSSLGFNRYVGYRAGTSLPFRWFDAGERRGLRLLEVPLVAHDVGLLGEWGLELGLERARDAIRGFFDRAAATGSALTLVFHPDKLVHDDWGVLYEWTLDEAIARGAWVTSLAALGDWWRDREARLLAA